MGRKSRAKRQPPGGQEAPKPISRFDAPTLKKWLKERAPLLRVIGLFCLLAMVFSFLFQRYGDNRVVNAYKDLLTFISGNVLLLFGEDVQIQGNRITGPFSMMVEPECLAIQATLLYFSAVLAFPTRIKARLVGVALGGLFLQSMNLVRIVSLYYVGRFFYQSFKFVHLEVWQFTFIGLAFFSWLFWVHWAIKDRPATPHA